MANPRIIARVGASPAGDYGVLTVADEEGSATLMLPDAATVAFFERYAAKVTILAGLEAADRTYRESRVHDFDGADIIAVDAAKLRDLAAQIEAHRKALEKRHG